MDSEFESGKNSKSDISSMENSGTSNKDVPEGFTSAVNNAMRSIRGDVRAFHVHGFAFEVNNAVRSIRENLGTSHSSVHGFASEVNNAMRSIRGDVKARPMHGFASEVNNAIRSIREDLGTSHSPVHGFTLGVDNVMSNATEDVEHYRSFSMAELVAATNNFSVDNKIGVGYRGKLVDGREVAIKRGEMKNSWSKRKSEIISQLAFLSRLPHKHLVRLVGFCEEKDEWLLVYEFMKNGALCDHLHNKDISVLNSWSMRIKVALGASQGIKYLHNYKDPSIHGDINSSNILIDATWTAKVSDFGLTFMKNKGPTFGYNDPEYYDINRLTTKSDVFGLGIVLLELLTGKRSIFKSGEDGSTPLHVVDYAVPATLAGELVKILDPMVGPPDANEEEALKIVANTAVHCVNLKGRDRPTMDDIVTKLERALAICDR